MEVKKETTRMHDGVYAIVQRPDGKLLALEKKRGPYTGLQDAPGGGREEKETTEQTLWREIFEETGLKKKHFFPEMEIGEKFLDKFNHKGQFFILKLKKENPTLVFGDADETDKETWFEVSDVCLERFTPLLVWAVEEARKKQLLVV